MIIPRSTATLPARRKFTFALAIVLGMFALGVSVTAHPLGNFTVNHFTRIEAGTESVRVRYVVDMAEIPAFQESQVIDANSDGTRSDSELNAYLERAAQQYLDGLLVSVDGQRVALSLMAKTLSQPEGAGGLPTLRIECDFEGALPVGSTGEAHGLSFEDTNHRERIGWREIVAAPASGVKIFDSTAFGNALTNELKAYPQDMLTAPLDERTAKFSWTTSAAALPSGAVALRTRDGRPVEQSRDRLAELIGVKELTLPIALLGLLLAAGFGALHAFSPGHGKTVVGAYLVGSRGTARHAAFLGLTVTITHTLGVFALGLVTLFASQYIVPERLFPILSLISGLLVLVVGLSLFVKRLRGAFGIAGHAHHQDDDAHTHDGHEFHQHAHTNEDGHEHSHDGLDAAAMHTHSHGGREHTHLPPGTDGSPVTWRSLLALGISGGLLPCPSALVVMLSAISLGRVAYGLALVIAFSIGLAATLSGIGLLFVYAGRFIKRSVSENRFVRVLPVVSAFVIACVGAVICYEALTQAGAPRFAQAIGNFFSSASAVGTGETSLTSMGAFAILGLGLVFGLKHATEVDHVVAVSTIVSEHRQIGRAALVGGLWGIGHTLSLLVVGVVVLALRVAVPEGVSNWLEFGVALMIIGLGCSALVRALLRRRAQAHVHRHQHDGTAHAHIHFHEGETAHEHGADSHAVPHSHAISRLGFKPLLVGAMHGLAGSATLTLLVLTQINSALLGLLYLAVFGLGSIFGMLLMSFLIGLPFALSARRLTGVNYGLQAAAGGLSIAFGLWYAYQTGFVSGLL
jgi:ABC-type nickel/cobalt efflux system permease component RcnA